MITPQENILNRDNVMLNWKLGPAKATVIPTENSVYWQDMAKIWMVSETEARAMLCANCEYYMNNKDMQLEMNSIPLDQFDMDGGGRGFCEKFDFICHNLRTCQAWEDKATMDELEEESMKLVIADIIKYLGE